MPVSTPETAELRRLLARVGTMLRHRIHNPLQAIVSEAGLMAGTEPQGGEAPPAQAVADAAQRIAEALRNFEAWALAELQAGAGSHEWAGRAPASTVTREPWSVESSGPEESPAVNQLADMLATELSLLARSLEAPGATPVAMLHPRVRRAARLASRWLTESGCATYTSSGAKTTFTSAPPAPPTAAPRTPPTPAPAPTAGPAAVPAPASVPAPTPAPARTEDDATAGGAGGADVATAALADRLRRLEGELAEEKARVSAQQQAFDFAAHELRNAANALSAWLRSLQDSEPANRPWYPTLLRAGEDVLRLSEEAVEATRTAAGPDVELLPCDLADIARDALERVEPVANAQDIRTALVVPAGAPVHVTADPDRTVQILLNLLRNALDATPEGGAITITVRVDDGHGVAEVEDTGPGLDPAALEDFTRTGAGGRTSRRAGTGLGLFFSGELARRMHGDLEHRTTGRPTGAILALRLPLAPES